MKYLFLLLFFFTEAGFVQTMDSWEICRGKKILAKGKEGDPVPVVIMPGSDTSAIIINFKEAPSNVQWKRDFIMKTGTDSILHHFSFTYSTGKFRLPVAGLSQLIDRHGPVTLLTEQHPAKDDVMIRSKMLVLAVFQKK